MGTKTLLVCALLICGSAMPGIAGPEAKTAAAIAAPAIDEAAARLIAWRHGLIRIEEIELSADRWEIAGRDRSGLESTLEIDAMDGAILR